MTFGSGRQGGQGILPEEVQRDLAGCIPEDVPVRTLDPEIPGPP